MALASQSSRSGSRRAYMTSRRRRRRGRWLILLFLIAGSLGAWWWFDRADPAESTENATTTREPETVATNPPSARTSSSVTESRRRTPSMDPVTRRRSESGRTPVVDQPVSSSRPDPANVAVVEIVPPSETAITSSSLPSETAVDASGADQPRGNVAGADRTVAGIEKRTLATRRLRQASELAVSDAVDARRALSEAWIAGLSGPDRDRARDLSRRLGDATLLENPEVPGSPWTRSYLIRPGDSMSVIMSRERVPTSQTFVARLNGLRNANAITAGEPLQLPTGRFHAVVDLSSRDLALFQEVEGSRDLLVVMPLAVGPRLRDDTGSFEGIYQVKPRGKRRNPSWTDPVTGIRWDRADPENPVGEHWIGLQGLGDTGLPSNLGLHGTNDPGGVIGGRLPGSIALADGDIELLYQVLDTGDSTVEIRK